MSNLSHPQTPRTATPPHPPLLDYYASGDERQRVVNSMFDDSAAYYEWICRVMSLGFGSMYRREALLRGGLKPGMKVIDVATGTGLVARAALSIVGDPSCVVGVDPSSGMLRESRKVPPMSLVQGVAERLPFGDERFDLLSMGYALRHISDLDVTFREYHRVLKRGGRLVIMEFVKPQSRLTRFCFGMLLQRFLPVVTRIGTRSPRAQQLMRYCWDTVATCVPHEVVLEALRRAAFERVAWRSFGAILGEYHGVRS
jgi:demethylmenaquinone methyltransferase / 2-methoxy-6-polyprenyl-1,4-benzoquinol methylase